MIVGIITGPTASGKSSAALELARQGSWEIISADSRQIYQGFKIGTAQPSPLELQEIPHHLVNFLDVNQRYSAAEFLRFCSRMHESSQKFLVVGGTGFYLNALIFGLKPIGSISSQSKLRLERMIADHPWSQVYQGMCELDSQFSLRIHETDRYRVCRAWEVYFETGRLYSSYLNEDAQGGLGTEIPLFSLEMDREILIDRINARIHLMLEMGWLAEVEDLLQRYGAEIPPMLTLGYPQLVQVLRGERNLADAITEIQIRTRQMAKHQRTYFRGQFPHRLVCTSIHDLITNFKKV